jgi:hypothetical protein
VDFFKLLQSLDELLYEVVSWLVFYPITLWRIIRSPIATLRLAEKDALEPAQTLFDELVSPPIFLLLTLILVHSVELATIGESEVVANTQGFSGLISSDTSLIIFRILTFAVLPLAAAVRLLRLRGIKIGKVALKAPFYAQCYVGGLFALMWDAASLFAAVRFALPAAVYLSALVLSLGWLFVVEARWFATEAKGSRAAGFRNAAIMIGQWLALVALTVLLFR